MLVAREKKGGDGATLSRSTADIGQQWRLGTWKTFQVSLNSSGKERKKHQWLSKLSWHLQRVITQSPPPFPRSLLHPCTPELMAWIVTLWLTYSRKIIITLLTHLKTGTPYFGWISPSIFSLERFSKPNFGSIRRFRTMTGLEIENWIEKCGRTVRKFRSTWPRTESNFRFGLTSCRSQNLPTCTGTEVRRSFVRCSTVFLS